MGAERCRQTVRRAHPWWTWVVAVSLLLPGQALAHDVWTHLHPLVQRYRVGELTGLDADLERVDTGGHKPAQAVIAFLRARIRAASGDGEGALKAWKAARAVRDVSAASYEWAGIEALRAAGKTADALDKLRQFRQDHGQFRWAAADLLYSRLTEQVSPPSDAADIAMQMYEKSQLHLPRDELLARAARMTQGDSVQRSKALWKRLLMSHPESEFVDEASRFVDPANFSDAEQYERMERLFGRRSYERCREIGLLLWKKGYRASEVGYYLGKIGSERLRDDYPGAAMYLEAAIDEKAPLAMQALNSYSLVLAKLDRGDEAIARFDEWIKRYPDAPLERRTEVHYDRARALHVGGKSLQAAESLREFLEAHRGVGDWGKYWWFVGFWYYRGGDYDHAISAMKVLEPNSNPLVGGKARYWMAKALDKAGQRADAVAMLAALVKHMPLNYYSALAEDLLGEWGQKEHIPRRPDLSKISYRDHDPFDDMPDTPEVERLRMAVFLGEPDTANDVFTEVRRAIVRKVGKARFARFEDELSDALEHFASRRETAYAKYGGVLASEPTAATVARWRAIYPRAYATHVVAASKRFGAPEWMIYAHMLQESRYKPWLISGAPAFGLLELLDRTAARLAREQHEDYALWQLMVPGWNVHWGAQYLGALYKKFHQQLPFAIASYNGGPMLLEYHLKVSEGRKLAFDELIDDLGPHESRNYVRMVIGHFLRYLAIYETPKRAAELRAQLLPKVWSAGFLTQPDY